MLNLTNLLLNVELFWQREKRERGGVALLDRGRGEREGETGLRRGQQNTKMSRGRICGQKTRNFGPHQLQVRFRPPTPAPRASPSASARQKINQKPDLCLVLVLDCSLSLLHCVCVVDLGTLDTNSQMTSFYTVEVQPKEQLRFTNE